MMQHVSTDAISIFHKFAAVFLILVLINCRVTTMWYVRKVCVFCLHCTQGITLLIFIHVNARKKEIRLNIYYTRSLP